MKKVYIILILALLALSIFVGCASKSAYDAVKPESGVTSGSAQAPAAAPRPDADYDYSKGDDGGYDYAAGMNSGAPPEATGSVDLMGNNVAVSNTAEKIIYYANVQVETIDFEKTLDTIDILLDRYGAFLESSSVTGRDYNTYYYGYRSYRSASFIIRVPVAQYEGMRGSLPELGNVVYTSSQGQNITAQFYDTESRLNAYRAEEVSLLNMLEKAQNVEEMLMVEDHLADVRYRIESLQTTLNTWQNQVDYSTISLDIKEVQVYTEETVIPRTFGEEIVDAFNKSVKWLVQAGKDIVVFLVAAIPVLIVPVVIIIVLIVVLTKRSKKNRANRALKYATNFDPLTGQPINKPDSDNN